MTASTAGGDPRVVTARHALLPDGWQAQVALELVGDRLRAVRPATAADPPAAGVALPGLFNAHAHLELSDLAGQVPATALGFHEWAGRLRRTPRAEDRRAHAADAARAVAAAGTAALVDVTNAGDTAALLEAAGLSGIVAHELLGFDEAAWPARAAAADALDDRVGDIWVRPTAHAIYSTAPGLLQAALAPRGAPATVHLAEDRDEEAFLHGEGPWPQTLDALGVRWRWFTPPRRSPVAWLDALGVLRPDVLLVHGVHLSPDDRARIAARRAPLVLCPRSNLHIGGQLPDVPALLQAGVRLALGTDSLASAPSLDVLAEIPVLARAFPAVPSATWFALATRGGADVLGAPHHGALRAGTRPGVVWFPEVDHPDALLTSDGAAAARTWLARPGPLWPATVGGSRSAADTRLR